MHRRPVNKAKSAGEFRRQIRKTKRPNVAPPSPRGGYRL